VGYVDSVVGLDSLPQGWSCCSAAHNLPVAPFAVGLTQVGPAVEARS
jgi:hypothetical protein